MSAVRTTAIVVRVRLSFILHYKHVLLLYAFMPLASRVISTLCLNRLRSLDRIDISGRKRPSLTLPCGTQSLPYGHDNCGQLVFPPDTRGFLYYYTPPKAPPLAGEVRFRLASDLDSFHDGTDLLSIDKIPWSISLFDLANLSTHLRLREQLLADGLISQATLDKWAGNKPPLLYERYRVGRNRIVLYYLRQPFFLRFNANFIVFNTATREQIGLCIMQNPLKDKHFEPNSHTRYSGELESSRLAVHMNLQSTFVQEAAWFNWSLIKIS